jgi:ribosome-binding factor A
MKKNVSHKGPSQRQLRVGELIRHELAAMFLREDIDEPELAGALVTVSEVKVSPDLKHATAFILPTGDAAAGAAIVAALTRRRKFVRGEIARRIDLRFAPEIDFKLDVSLDRAERVEELLRSPAVRRDLG